MAQLEELRLMAKVAHLYHTEGLTQKEIGARLTLSQATISRLLKRAIDEKIVRTTVSLPAGVYADLEEKVRQTYNLREVIIVDSLDPDNEPEIQRNLGAAAAFYLENSVRQHEIIGISSWSSTLLAMVDAMHPIAQVTNAQVVQILGGVGQPGAEVHAARLTDRLAKLVNGTARFLSAPGIVGSADARNILLNDPYVADTLAMFDQVTLALVGIGSVQPSQLLASSGNIFSEAELELLRQQGAVGDICLRFFNDNGVPAITPLNERVIGMPLERLSCVERTVGISGGRRKHAAVRGALEGRWVNVLITDRFTAEYLL
ncbi:MAG TPA: sugar-binding transcriptional regulator [Aggregatilinea sp.]|jgi:DNA-binding transcriptional regulator LsrR (DeoR family)|uniref:sugar-binding transcriptional regulator n=1 Tax=Aggregatilinea sp. TaxID=2806333 RepID=UPI002BD16BAD|nr:sugar-binding transcriptional regulator [Aggregatilinea sp.]HML20543.1 sugar-binding transcriptional regulator [Aggregatilinea sp.]